MGGGNGNETLMYQSRQLSLHLVRVLPRDRVQRNAGPDNVLLAVLSPILGLHHLFAAGPHAVQQPVRTELVLVVDAFFLGLGTVGGGRAPCAGVIECLERHISAVRPLSLLFELLLACIARHRDVRDDISCPSRVPPAV